jgi:hypothetical protein
LKHPLASPNRNFRFSQQATRRVFPLRSKTLDKKRYICLCISSGVTTLPVNPEDSVRFEQNDTHGNTRFPIATDRISLKPS